MRATCTFILLVLFLANLLGQVKRDTSLVLFSKNVYFENGQATIDTVQLKSLHLFLDSLQKINGKLFVIEGHTNDIGSQAYNLQLSASRANAVKNSLLQHHIDSSTISIIALGKSHPEWSNKEEKGLALNRQVKIKVMKKFSLRTIKGKALDSLIAKKDVLIIARNQFYSDTTYTGDDGKFELNVPEKIPLKIMARKKGYLTDMVEIVVDDNTNEVAIALLPIRLQQSIQIQSINFVGNKCIVLPQSMLALENLREQIKINDHFCFEIQGHVNAPRVSAQEVGKYMDLSRARAGAVYSYLINANVEKTRMYCEGYGHLKMLYPQAIYEREMSLNRRVELKVYDCLYIAEKRKRFDEEMYLKLSKTKVFSQVEY